ncbi:Histidine kinase [Hymenobacter gelipurpurascens]|uniref:Histidine kinase n=1 Tax=Hymenobacter gelipurpurascens TaxID=89968 RepID=A0A212T4D4_9BACT|nr:sensor histidine kinase [Hymenobacter gelipurpurascens]SNC60696.1 Histidine kinase [Hymenobacter gelipurpurascens]
MITKEKTTWQRVLRVIIHVACWVGVACIPRLLSDNPPPFQWHMLVHPALLAGFFYLNYYVLIPRFFAKKQFLAYFGVVLVLLGLFYAPFILRETGIKKRPPRPPDAEGRMPPSASGQTAPGQWHTSRGGTSGFPNMPPRSRPPQGLWMIGILVWIISSGLRITNEWFETERARRELQNNHLTAELAFLKSQVSPHFLFNTLNNIYSLAQMKADEAPEAILQLSHLMRYMLYESEAARVPLEREVAYIRNYMDLQRLRLDPEQAEISFTVAGNLGGCLIEPMLLIPFVENAFKHGISSQHPSRIAVELAVDGTQLHFAVRNTRFPNTAADHDPNSGIGLPNVQQRLALLYPDRYQLQLDQTPTEYCVDLTLTMAYAPLPVS